MTRRLFVGWNIKKVLLYLEFLKTESPQLVTDLDTASRPGYAETKLLTQLYSISMKGRLQYSEIDSTYGKRLGKSVLG